MTEPERAGTAPASAADESARHDSASKKGDHEGGVTGGVGFTALAVAAARASETVRTDPICSDPYAEALVAAADAPLPTRPLSGKESGWDAELAGIWDTMAGHLGLRTRFFDDYVTAAAAAGIRQVVILAAGLDTRAHRLDWPCGTTVFELDQPRVLEFKDHVLSAQSGCERITVPVDLREDWPAALREAGFDPAVPTAWLAEGLLRYLPGAAVRELFARITELSAPGSLLGVNETRDESWHPQLRRFFAQFGIDPSALRHVESARPQVATWFPAHGWQTPSLVTGRELAERHQRALPAEAADWFAAHSDYFTTRLPGRPER
ncbi:SAM-dependent methyltransferase [Saccharopolyspora sp. HNM0986]|uniref:SAM-dependent methyltransferase n=1 Tax=Saccharopolyspora galaxeae TaxID=2781241 RepID=UPI0019098A3B|nr:SAM-dependent methyltransferase [Saccharopolyspora sp. HNM0986]MBK0869760.1 SAM-dependent methyltransferase [Saccharopolyspora sp. HNM0986]